MEISGLIILCLIIFASLLFIRLITRRNIPVDPPVPNPKQKLIGGCKGTRFGCCPDMQTSCIDEQCSNCLMDATPDLGTLENAYNINEQNKLDFKLQNDRLNKIEKNLDNLKELKETINDEIKENEDKLENPFLEKSSREHIERQILFKKEELSEVNKEIENLEEAEEEEEEELSEKASILSQTETFFKDLFSKFTDGKINIDADNDDDDDDDDDGDGEPADPNPNPDSANNIPDCGRFQQTITDINNAEITYPKNNWSALGGGEKRTEECSTAGGMWRGRISMDCAADGVVFNHTCTFNSDLFKRAKAVESNLPDGVTPDQATETQVAAEAARLAEQQAAETLFERAKAVESNLPDGVTPYQATEAQVEAAEEAEEAAEEAARLAAELRAKLCSIGNDKAFQITKTFTDENNNHILKLYNINNQLELHKSPPCGGKLLEFEADCVDDQVFKIKEKSSGHCFSQAPGGGWNLGPCDEAEAEKTSVWQKPQKFLVNDWLNADKVLKYNEGRFLHYTNVNMCLGSMGSHESAPWNGGPWGLQTRLCKPDDAKDAPLKMEKKNYPAVQPEECPAPLFSNDTSNLCTGGGYFITVKDKNDREYVLRQMKKTFSSTRAGKQGQCEYGVCQGWKNWASLQFWPVDKTVPDSEVLCFDKISQGTSQFYLKAKDTIRGKHVRNNGKWVWEEDTEDTLYAEGTAFYLMGENKNNYTKDNHEGRVLFEEDGAYLKKPAPGSGSHYISSANYNATYKWSLDGWDPNAEAVGTWSYDPDKRFSNRLIGEVKDDITEPEYGKDKGLWEEHEKEIYPHIFKRAKAVLKTNQQMVHIPPEQSCPTGYSMKGNENCSGIDRHSKVGKNWHWNQAPMCFSVGKDKDLYYTEGPVSKDSAQACPSYVSDSSENDRFKIDKCYCSKDI